MQEQRQGQGSSKKKTVSWVANGRKSGRDKRVREVETETDADGEDISDDDVDKEEEEEQKKRNQKRRQKLTATNDDAHLESGGVTDATGEANSISRRPRVRWRVGEQDNDENSVDREEREEPVRASPQRPRPNNREEQENRWMWVRSRIQDSLGITPVWSPVAWYNLSKKAFRQQRLPVVWHPIWDGKMAGRLLLVLAIITLPLALYTFFVEMKTPEYRFTFSEECKNSRNYLRLIRSMCVFCGGALNPHCSKVINIPEDMKTPVFLYYEIVGFYQIHRKIAKSVDYAQLNGDIFNNEGKPVEPSDNCGNYSRDPNGKIYYPCGQLANKMYNDEFSLETASGELVPFRIHGIALDHLKQLRFKNPPEISPKNYHLKLSFKNNFVKPKDWTQEMWDNWWKGGGMENERFINWMNPSSSSPFRKLYAVIDYVPKCPSGRFCKGNYTINIEYRFDTDRYYGDKAFILASMSYFGAKNYAIPLMLAILGCLELALGLCFVQIDTTAKKWSLQYYYQHKHRPTKPRQKRFPKGNLKPKYNVNSRNDVGDGPLQLDPTRSVSVVTKFPVTDLSDVGFMVPGSSKPASEGINKLPSVSTLFRRTRQHSEAESQEVLPDDKMDRNKLRSTSPYHTAKIKFDESSESDAESFTSARSMLVSAAESSPETEIQVVQDKNRIRKRR